MSTPIGIPKSPDDITLGWLNSILNVHQIQVKDFTVLGDAKRSRGALSDLLRLQLQVIKNNSAPEDMRLVLKSLPSDPNVRAYVLAKRYCQNEVQMYLKVLPAINAFLDSRGVSQTNRFSFPKCYFGQEEEGSNPEDYNFILVLEDLVASKYTFWDEGPKKSFDWDHASVAIKSIARFHAASAAYKIAKGFRLYEEEFPNFIKHSIDDPALDNYISTGFKATKEILSEVDLPDGLLERLNVLETKFKPIVQKMLIDIDEKSFNVIRHTDLHFFNVAFQYNQDNHCVDCKWFDFQNCSEGGPMLDVGFLLILNCEPELSTVLLDKSLTLYYNTFTSIFQEAKIDFRYTWEKMKDEFKMFRITAILHIISGAPVWVCGPNANEVSRERLRRAIIYAYENGEFELPNLL